MFGTAKTIKEFDSVQLMDLDNKLYLVAGKHKIFLLGAEGGDNWAHELSSQEIDGLSVDVFWTGIETDIEADSKKATELSKCSSFRNMTI